MGEVGARVRVVAGPGRGGIGKIAEVSQSPCALESGVIAWGAEVTLTTGDRVFVPWENLELFG